MDLVALNTQRGRDHGLPGYIHYREICRVGKVHSFDDLENNISKEVVWKCKLSPEHLNSVRKKVLITIILIAIIFTEHQKTETEGTGAFSLACNETPLFLTAERPKPLEK